MKPLLPVAVALASPLAIARDGGTRRSTTLPQAHTMSPKNVPDCPT